MAAIHDLIALVGDERVQCVRPLEPHDPSRDDSADKALGLARFAERHGARFGRIRLIRKRRSAGGAAQFVRLEINRREVLEQVLLPSAAVPLDKLLDGVH